MMIPFRFPPALGVEVLVGLLLAWAGDLPVLSGGEEDEEVEEDLLLTW